MGIWTHINGSISINAIEPEESVYAKVVDSIGNIKKNISYNVISHKYRGVAYSYSICFYGNLDEWSDTRDVETWFNLLTHYKFRDCIKQGILQIDVDSLERKIFLYDYCGNKTISVN